MTDFRLKNSWKLKIKISKDKRLKKHKGIIYIFFGKKLLRISFLKNLLDLLAENGNDNNFFVLGDG